mgnify:FL=1
MSKCKLCGREKREQAGGWLCVTEEELVCPMCQEIPGLEESQRLRMTRRSRKIGEGCQVVRRGRIVAVESLLLLQSVLARTELAYRSTKGRSPERDRLSFEKAELRVAVLRLREWLFMSFGASGEVEPEKKEEGLP